MYVSIQYIIGIKKIAVLPFLLQIDKIRTQLNGLLGARRIRIQWKFNMGYMQGKVLITLYPISDLNLHKNSTYLKGLLSLFHV